MPRSARLKDLFLGKMLLRIFRPAKDAAPGVHIARTAAQTAVFWLVFLALIPALIVWLEERWSVPSFSFPTQSWSPWVLFALAGLLGLTSGFTMARLGRGTPLPLAAPQRLVVAGPYRWVRNPMVVAGLAQGLAVGSWLGSWGTLLYVLLGGVFWHLTVRPLEEGDLLRRLGEPYADYRRTVPLWIPRRPPS